MALAKSVAVHNLAFLVLAAFVGVCAADPCFTGGVCCSNCNSWCPGKTIQCFQNCKKPCFDVLDCVNVGQSVAQGVAVSACEKTKSDCGVGFPSKAAFFSVDLKGCCKIVRGSCIWRAKNIACTVSNYGSCTAAQFKSKYDSYVASECKSAICNDAACKDVLAGDPGC